ncbi:hypothetical protein DIPPA_19949 [Diplonema papillatum]|nr:hypothetical protein DIPPA_19949 [Diplonema papillatum]
MVPPQDWPEEMRHVGWTRQEVNLSDLYPDETPVVQLKKENQLKTRKATNEFSSSAAMKEAKDTHARGPNNPHEKWHGLVTSNQAYGWSRKQPGSDLKASGEFAAMVGETKNHKKSSDEAKYSEAMLKQGMF